MSSFEQFFNRTIRGPVPTVIEKTVSLNVKCLQVIRDIIEQPPFSYTWMIKDMNKFKQFLTKTYMSLNQKYRHTIAYRKLPYDKKVSVQMEGKFSVQAIVSISYPRSNFIHATMHTRVRQQLIDDHIKTVEDILLFCFKFKRETIVLNLWQEEDAKSRLNLLKPHLEFFNVVSTVDVAEPKAVVDALAYCGFTQKDIFKIKLKLNIPVEPTDDLLAGIT